MTTEEIMQIALSLSGLDEVPGDCGIVVRGENIRRILAGIDMETAEIILGKRLGYDLVLSHHPVTGPMQANFYKASDYLGELLERAGAPANAAQRSSEWLTKLQEGKNHPVNYGKSADTARLLNMPYMGIHNIADALGGKLLQAFLDERLADNPCATLKDLCDILMEVPEYQKGLTRPEIVVGREDDLCGRVFVIFGGGPFSGKEYFRAGVGTMICMHMPDEYRQRYEQEGRGNVIVCDHMASDSIGMNAILHKLEDRGAEVTRVAGIFNDR